MRHFNKFNAIIEMSTKSIDLKYEFINRFNLLSVDRKLLTCMYYPYNYGFIPNTISSDGDPMDVMIISNSRINRGALVSFYPIGALIMFDNNRIDSKIVGIIDKDIDSYPDIRNYNQLSKDILKKIECFFLFYKKLDKSNKIEILGWCNNSYAVNIIRKSMINDMHILESL